MNDKRMPTSEFIEMCDNLVICGIKGYGILMNNLTDLIRTRIKPIFPLEVVMMDISQRIDLISEYNIVMWYEGVCNIPDWIDLGDGDDHSV